MTNEAPETDEVPTVEARMGYYKDAKTGEWLENGIGMGWCKECGAKIRFCKCSENAHTTTSEASQGLSCRDLFAF